MTLFGVLGFSSPWLLLGLLALPVLWVILRAVPPAPVRRLFPGVVLLLGLKDDDQITDRTPWWLLLIRMLAVAAVIVGFAGPVLNPEQSSDQTSKAPLLVVMDGSWASAAHWRARMASLDGLLAQAGRDERPVALLQLTDPQPVQFTNAEVLRSRLGGLTPQPWLPGPSQMQDAANALPEDAFDSYWLSDGLARDSRTDFLTLLEARGNVQVFENARNIYALLPAALEDGHLTLTLKRLHRGPAATVTLAGHGKDPSGNPAILFEAPVTFDENALEAVTKQSLPAEMRARITRLEILGARSAGAVALPDDSLRRREVALIAGREDRESLQLLDPLHYLVKALTPAADILKGALMDILPANPDVIVLADVATLGPLEQSALLEWMDQGGLLLRFAGPRLAASEVSRRDEDPLMPVRLRAGGRTVGGAMSWGEPKSLAPFQADSPFYGLEIPDDVTVHSQVMAQPDPALASRVIAQLSDGTPLVTRKTVGQGQVVLVHVTANADWSNLPISGLFVQMLERLSVSSTTPDARADIMEGTVWQPISVLDGFGNLRDGGTMPGIEGTKLASGPLGPDLRPGVYQSDETSLARNTVSDETGFAPVVWPAHVAVSGLQRTREQPVGGWLLAMAIALLVADIVASLALSGRLGRAQPGSVGMLFSALMVLSAPEAKAQTTDEQLAIAATSDVVFAHVLTGDTDLDRLAAAAMRGLSDTLYYRTSVEPAPPMGIDLETDELAFFPFIYWPVTASQPVPSDAAYARLNAYLRSGGMILFDTRDADIAGFGSATANGRKLQELALQLDIPALEPIPQDHVLTRTFYLLQDFPGRYIGRDVWVEAAPQDAELIDGMPFRNLNDNVTPVVIGGNDWASAWAVDQTGSPLVPLGRGFTGEQQREIANRFGVNLIMHVLTGNYKSDQVHVPALLDRLGQ